MVDDKPGIGPLSAQTVRHLQLDDTRAQRGYFSRSSQPTELRNFTGVSPGQCPGDQTLPIYPSVPIPDPPLSAGRIKRLSMETIAFVLDIFLVIAAIVAYLARPRIGGQLAKGLQILMTGILVLGFAHLIETLFFTLLFVDRPLNEVIHRLLVAAGFIFVIVGFVRMRKAFDG
jgi:hypothetical protein